MIARALCGALLVVIAGASFWENWRRSTNVEDCRNVPHDPKKKTLKNLARCPKLKVDK